MLRRTLLPLAVSILGAAVLVSLGIWQMDRLPVKEAQIAEIDARIASAPGPLPAIYDPGRDRYAPVRMTGTVGEGEVRVLASTKAAGAIHRIVAPFETDEGRRILLDRGYVSARGGFAEAPAPAGRIVVEGNVHWPDERNGSTPDDGADLWFARDVPKMAAALGTEELMVVARATSEVAPATTPLPVDSSGIPNDHLGYMLTWFGLAAVWMGMAALFFWRQWRARSI